MEIEQDWLRRVMPGFTELQGDSGGWEGEFGNKKCLKYGGGGGAYMLGQVLGARTSSFIIRNWEDRGFLLLA